MNNLIWEIPGFPGCRRQINTDWVNQGELKKTAIHHALCEESVYGQSNYFIQLVERFWHGMWRSIITVWVQHLDQILH